MKLQRLAVLLFVLLPLTTNADDSTISKLTARIASLEEQISVLNSKLSALNLNKGTQEASPATHTKLLDLEEKVRELTGKIQYVDYTDKKIMEKINSLSSEINYRLSTIEGKNLTKEYTKKPPPLDTTSIQKYIKMIENGDYQGAVDGLKWYTKENQEVADLDEAYYWLGKAYMAQNMYDQSNSCFFKSYHHYPDKPRASESLLNVATSFMKLGNYRSGCNALDRLDREYPNRTPEEKAKSQEIHKIMGCSN